MTDLRPAQDVVAEILGCRHEIGHAYAMGQEINIDRCDAHPQHKGWPCPELIRVTALIEADRRAAMAKAWDEGEYVGRNIGVGDNWMMTNPYEADND